MREGEVFFTLYLTFSFPYDCTQVTKAHKLKKMSRKQLARLRKV